VREAHIYPGMSLKYFCVRRHAGLLNLTRIFKKLQQH